MSDEGLCFEIKRGNEAKELHKKRTLHIDLIDLGFRIKELGDKLNDPDEFVYWYECQLVPGNSTQSDVVICYYPKKQHYVIEPFDVVIPNIEKAIHVINAFKGSRFV